MGINVNRGPGFTLNLQLTTEIKNIIRHNLNREGFSVGNHWKLENINVGRYMHKRNLILRMIEWNGRYSVAFHIKRVDRETASQQYPVRNDRNPMVRRISR